MGEKVKKKKKHSGNNGAWTSFLSGLLGAIIGGAATFCSTVYQIEGTRKLEIDIRKLELQQEVLQELFSVSDVVAQREKLEGMIAAGFLNDSTKKYSLMFHDTAFFRSYIDSKGCFEFESDEKEFDMFTGRDCDLTGWKPTHRKILCNSALGQNFNICVNDSGFSRFSFEISTSNFIDTLGCALVFHDKAGKEDFAEVLLSSVSIPASNSAYPKPKTLVYLIYSEDVRKYISEKGHDYLMDSCVVNTRWSCGTSFPLGISLR